jgi:pimeloyl-ACP methyl ester carboxylesterase
LRSPARRVRSPRRRGTARPLARLALAAAVVVALRTAVRVRRELADFRRSEARLRSDWCEISSQVAARRLRVHARIGDSARTVLPPVVLVHGWGIGSTYWVPLAARLARHAHTYAPDLPGHGASDHDDRPLSTLELAFALAEWMDSRRLRSAILVGHSLGCQIAAELAARRPDLVTGLVLVGPTADPAAPRPGDLFVRAGRTVVLESPSLMMWGALDYARAGPGVLAGELRTMLEHRIEDVLPDVRAPVRVVRGARDRIVPQRWARAVARLVDAPEPVAVEGSAHAVNYADPDALVKVVFSLIRDLRASAAGVHPVRAGGGVHPTQEARL